MRFLCTYGEGLVDIVIKKLVGSTFRMETKLQLRGLNGADIELVDPSSNNGEYGIVAVHLTTPTGPVVLD